MDKKQNDPRDLNPNDRHTPLPRPPIEDPPLNPPNPDPTEPDPSPALLNKGLANIATNVKRILDISRRLVTFNGMGFDVPTLIQRSRLLRVPVPHIDQRRFGNVDQQDLYKALTFDDSQRTSA